MDLSSDEDDSEEEKKEKPGKGATSDDSSEVETKVNKTQNIFEKFAGGKQSESGKGRKDSYYSKK